MVNPEVIAALKSKRKIAFALNKLPHKPKTKVLPTASSAPLKSKRNHIGPITQTGAI